MCFFCKRWEPHFSGFCSDFQEFLQLLEVRFQPASHTTGCRQPQSEICLPVFSLAPPNLFSYDDLIRLYLRFEQRFHYKRSRL